MPNIPDVEPLRWGSNRENTFLGALTAAARAMGDDVEYEWLMGASGAAFRLMFHQPKWCPSSPDATCGFDHARPAFAALGRGFAIRHDPEPTEAARAAIVGSLDAGRPVVAIEPVATPDWGVICGVRDDGHTLLCRSYWDTAVDEYAVADKWPWALVIPGEKEGEPDREAIAQESLRLAVTLWETERFEKYASGAAAFRAWARDLRDEERFAEGETVGREAHVNGWCYESLLDARRAAVAYLRSIGVDAAADRYEQGLRRLYDGRSHVLMSREAKEGHLWTQPMRTAQAGILDEVAEHEAAAVGVLRGARPRMS